MVGLLDLSGEIFERAVLSLDDLRDFARVSQTCRAIYEIIYESDSHLWRSAYLARYDDPRDELGVKSPPGTSYDWKAALQRRVKAQRTLASATVTDEHVEAIEELLELSRQSPPGSVPSGRNIALLQELLAEPGREMLYANSNRPLLLSEGASMSRLDASQAAAKLSVYLGLGAEPRRSLRTSQRNGARALVYDLRTWTEEGLYGPLKADGTVDWRKAEAICFVACNNARDLTRSLGALGRTRLPCQLAGARPMSAPGWNSDEVPGDWAGVTGHWRRCINFCDWNDLQRYQSAVQRGEGSRFFASRFSGEAVRLLNMHLTVEGFDPPEDDDAPPDRLTILFRGTAEGGSPHEAQVHGKVWMNKDRDVCWRLTSRYGGQDRWYSMGAQVGGEQSAYGVLGVWSGLDHDFEHGDPAGPFWLWKVDDAEPDPHDPSDETEDEDDADAEMTDAGDVDAPAQDFGGSDSDDSDDGQQISIQDVLAYLNGALPVGVDFDAESDEAES